jgi:hypothetical protein
MECHFSTEEEKISHFCLQSARFGPTAFHGLGFEDHLRNHGRNLVPITTCQDVE